MSANIKRLITFLLAVILVIGLPVSTMATIVEGHTDETVAIPISEEETEEIVDSSVDAVAERNSLVTTAATTTTDLFFWNLAAPNYTVTLSSQLEIRYQISGEDSIQTAWIKILGWHYSKDPNRPLYCLEPCKDYGESTSYNAVDEGVALYGNADTHGTSVWFSLPEDVRYAIGLILLHSDAMWDYSYDVKTTTKEDNPNVPLRVVTQFLLWEVITGLRDAKSFVRKESNGYTDGDILYNAGAKDIINFASVYDSLVSQIKEELKIPSFTGSDPNNAPVISLTKKTITVKDTNGVLSAFSFLEGEGVSFSKKGNELTITQTGRLSSAEVFKCTRELLSPVGSTYSIWYSPYIPDYQTCITLHSEEHASVDAYFRLKAASGELALRKITEDGNNLEGWIFTVYADAECSHVISGPHITDSSGKIHISDLPEGTIYVKELGHTEPAIQKLYSCVSINPQKVTISSGETSSVSFTNNLQTGEVHIRKAMPDGGSVSGWTFEVYRVSDDAFIGSFISGEDGVILVDRLRPGEYRIVEKIPEDSVFYCEAANPQTVTVLAGHTAEVTFTNRLKAAEIAVQKVDTAGNPLAGAVFLMEWSVDGANWLPVSSTDSPYVTDGTCTSGGLLDGCLTSPKSGLVQFTGLHPERYYRLTEISAPDGYQLLAGAAYEGAIPTDESLTITLTVVNAPVYELPMTGSKSFVVMAVSLCICIAGCVGALVYLRRKEQ